MTLKEVFNSSQETVVILILDFISSNSFWGIEIENGNFIVFF